MAGYTVPAPAGAAGSPLFNPVIAKITLRALLGRRRAFLFGLPALVLLIVTVLLKGAHNTAPGWPGEVLGRVGFSAVLPLTGLLIGTSVLGSEVDDDSILHLLATPVSRASVVVTKTLVAFAATAMFAAVPELAAGFIAKPSPGSFGLGLFLGSLVGALVYSCLFVCLSTLTRHPVAYGLGYVALWEGLISNIATGAKYISVEQWSLGVANSMAKDSSLSAHLTATTSLILSAIAVAVLVYAAATRLRSFRVAAD